MLVVCTIALAINTGGINIISKADVEGKLLKEDSYKYLVDFTEGVKKYNIAGKPEDYNKVIVNKDDCVKE